MWCVRIKVGGICGVGGGISLKHHPQTRDYRPHFPGFQHQRVKYVNMGIDCFRHSDREHGKEEGEKKELADGQKIHQYMYM